MEDFFNTYLPLHGLEPAQGMFRFLDIFMFVEATIYQMDEENEALCEGMALAAGASGDDVQQQQHTFQGEAVLLEVLEQQQLLTERVRAELAAGQQYWAQERAVCRELAQLRPGHEPRLSLATLLATHELKSFDYRVMHLLLHELLRRPYNEVLLGFMRLDELLIDIGDDLTDYEDDVMANSFNIFRGYVYLYGTEAPVQLAARISQLEAQRRQLLAQLPPALQAKVLQRQRDAAVEEGADKWVFPDAILDEPAYRTEVRELEAAGAS